MGYQHPSRDDAESLQLEGVDNAPEKSTTLPLAAAPDVQVLARNGPNKAENGLLHARQASAASTAIELIDHTVVVGGSVQVLQSIESPAEQNVIRSEMTPSVLNQGTPDGDVHGTGLVFVNLPPRAPYSNGSGGSICSTCSNCSDSSMDVNVRGSTSPRSRSKGRKARSGHEKAAGDARNPTHNVRTSTPETRVRNIKKLVGLDHNIPTATSADIYISDEDSHTSN